MHTVDETGIKALLAQPLFCCPRRLVLFL